MASVCFSTLPFILRADIPYTLHVAKHPCNIIKNGWRDRVQCYHTAGPFRASFQRWFCQRHNKSFSATTLTPELQTSITAQEANASLLIFPRIVVSQEFVLMVCNTLWFIVVCT
jgi:hypothetical protein